MVGRPCFAALPSGNDSSKGLCVRVEEMYEVMGGLILLLGVAVYCAVVVGKRTDQRILRLLTENSVDAPMQVRFPDDVLRPKEPAARATVREGKQSV